MGMRRNEILLPAEFNDGRLVANACPRWLPDSLAEVADTVGAFTFRPDLAIGSWTGRDCRRYDDPLFVLSVDVEDTLSTKPGSATSRRICSNASNNWRST